MGLAILIPGADFSSLNLGRVTLPEEIIEVTEITIIGDNEINNTGNASSYSVSYTPNNATQTGVTWSITNGGAYATINTNTGVVTVLEGATGNTVTIKATSVVNNNIYGIKNITVTKYSSTNSPVYFMPLITNGNDTITNMVPTAQSLVTYTSNGAYFLSNQRYFIKYDYGIKHIKAIAFSAKLDYHNASTYTYLIYNSTNVIGGSGTLYHQLNLCLHNNGTDSPTFISTISTDKTGAGNGDRESLTTTKLCDNVEHKICVAQITGHTKVYVDQVLAWDLDVVSFSEDTDQKMLVLGNNWRGVVDNGTRSPNGYIKNVSVYFDEITDNMAITLSKL